jgi:two-component sensor histidine kinase
MNTASILSTIALVCYLLLIEVTLRSPRQREVNRAFAAYLIAMAFWQFSALMVSISRSDAMALFWYRLMTVGSSGNFIFLAMFVKTYLGSHKNNRLLYVGWGSMIFLLATSTTDWIVRSVVTSETTGLHIPTFGPLVPVMSLIVFPFLGYAVYNLVQAYRRTQSNAQRNRMRYLLISAGVGTLGIFSNVFPVLQAYPVDVFANVISALLIAYAILRHQLLDISIVVRKGMLYSIPTLIIGAAYFLVISLAINIFHTTSGFSLFVLSLAVALVAALVAEPVRDRVQFWIDKLFFREKYDTRLMIERLSNLGAMELDLDVLIDTILSEVSRTIHISRGEFLLRDEKGASFYLAAQTGESTISELVLKKSHPVVEWLSSNQPPLISHELELMPVFRALWGEEREELEKIGAEVLLPVKAKGELVGIFALGPKLSQQPYSSEDQSTLTTLANQTAIAIEKARLYRDLEKTLVQLRGAHDDLELRVQERTAALAHTNIELQNEITERKKAEQQLAQSLQEKEALLKEIHHRVKNNMQVVSSLLSIQSGRVEDPQVLEILQDSQNRVRSMALIHEKLYQSENIAKVDLNEYANGLAHYLFSLYRKTDAPIAMDIQGDGVQLSIDEAVPCGLILNELISNSLKHAFPPGWNLTEPRVKIEMSQADDGEISVRVSDNGRGMRVVPRAGDTAKLGLQLVRMLVHQLNGEVEFSNIGGTTACFSFHKHA